MKKTLVALVILGLLIAVFSGCSGGIGLEARRRGFEGQKQAKQLANAHFQNKYGIQVQYESIKADYTGGNFDSDRAYSGLVDLVALYQGETILAQVEDGLVYDNYQAPEIEDAFLTYITRELGLQKPLFYQLDPQYRSWVYEFDTLLINEYFDGTNTEALFKKVSPLISMMYEKGAVLPAHLEQKVQALFGQTEAKEQQLNFFVLKPGSSAKIQNVLWSTYTAQYYAPYLEYAKTYLKGELSPPAEVCHPLQPLSQDTPLLEQMLTGKFGPGASGLEAREQEPPGGFEIPAGFTQITPSYYIVPKEDSSFCMMYIPPTVWQPWQAEYKQFYLLRLNVYANGTGQYMQHALNPAYTGYTDVALYGEYFVDHISQSGNSYFTFIGAK